MSKNPSQKQKRSGLSAGLLLAGMLLAAGMRLAWERRSAEVVAEPRSAPEWVAWAGAAAGEGRPDAAADGFRAALVAEPWHPGAVRGLTALLLAQGEPEALADWMESLLLGDARLAEQMFELPAFAAMRGREPFAALHQEAVIQARD